MKKMTLKKLQLTRETLRGLEDNQLTKLAGGATGSRTCTTVCSFCTY
jgi:hypothetical protein